MTDALIQLALFASKSLIVLFVILVILIVFFVLLAKGKDKTKGKLTITNLNHKYQENKDTILTEVLPKKLLKKHIKEQKNIEKEKEKSETQPKNVYVLNFNGDMKASAVATLREEITAVLQVAKPHDEVVVRLESPGGVVHGYGLGAAQLMRLRQYNIPLTITVDKVAASGGYMMACIANKVLCAPFAIVGSIGVIVQMPNFHRVLQDKHIGFEMHTAGEYKRTITMFGENTDEGRKKLQSEIEDIHQHFKNMILNYRPDIDIAKVATGEHWIGKDALTLKLVDEIKTSDEYLYERSKDASLYEISYAVKKPFLSKLSASANSIREKMLGIWL